MFLKEVIIDGFKSYASRTVVSGFDPAFNAITGLNGSGKSNVLDSICFVLGITNLSQVRASSLQELVYKNGQAGIRKATVTLVFDNANKEFSPVGYEALEEITVTRQVVVGGRNKYLINGHVAQPGRVQNLFHSVGLNVNNPHFLIMQGRITKVINMKPVEVLSMVEEAAGTKMYENKKETALKTIEKKERKKHEINSLLEDSISPSLKKLEEGRKHYMEWSKNGTEIDRLQRYLIAYEYTQASEILEKTSGASTEIGDGVAMLDERITSLTQSKKECSKSLAALIKSRESEFDQGSLRKMHTDVEDQSKLLVKHTSTWNNQKSALESEKAALKTLEESISSCQATLQTHKNEVVEAQKSMQEAEQEKKVAAEKVSNAETAKLTGAATQGTQGAGTGSAVQQLEDAKKEASLAQTEIANLNLRLKHKKTEHTTKSVELSKDRAGVRELEAQKKIADKAIATAKMAVHELDFDSESADALYEKRNVEQRDVAVLRERVNQLTARVSGFNFQYSEPYANFDHRRVHGLVAKLIRLKDPATATAIEVTAGGRLYQVVVDTDKTASDLLKKGRLTRRVTILPLNKINADTLDSDKIRRAKQLVPSTSLALDLVGYEYDVENAIKHVFGKTLICKDMDSAKTVTFDRSVYARSVTLDGEVYSPAGTISGGSSRRTGNSPLQLLGDLSDAEAELSIKEQNLGKLSAQIASVELKAKRYRQLTAELDIKRHEAELLAQRLGESRTGRLLNEVQELEQEINVEIPSALKNAKESLAKNSKRAEELELALQDADAARRQAEDEAEAAMATIKAEYDAAIAKAQAASDAYEKLLVQIETVETEIKSLTAQRIETVVPSIQNLENAVDALEAKVASCSKSFEEAQALLKDEEEKLAKSSEEISEMRAEIEKLAEKIEADSLEKAKLETKLREAQRGRSGAEKLVASFDEKYSWIAQEKELFGVEGHDYEFEDRRLAKSSKRLKQLEKTQEELSRKINKKAMHMFETAMDEYRSLMAKKEIVEKDKEKIEQVIAGLDKQKMIAVEKTWKKVNKDFGEIFSDLLPGTSAKLEPPEGMGIEDGLEIRVAFGDVWKDSLSELSGGQRSLIALSLILAMLRFKPAPMYILDEVDAALDLSHTQNIGRMLRKHFSGSQFIVVSLKEGMFNNANVIFRTKFVDGISTISRNVNTISFDEMDRRGLKNVPGADRSSTDKENVEEQGGVRSGRGGQKRRVLG